ncbi:MAG TPA: sodium:solute symporter [Bacteroidales bacterium]|nr:MAG: sodium:solute symporter [Bacteroidetes bacterium GWE2_42_24]OFY29515.1 MAG: sodium:solute symporter [Bacteroidetes bacterium GWF2_43_11]HAQ64717.1 sodium:solute symporter [Bacteroidales bacterium]HBZ67313.1 sodium:solute symporter [Bacteroidales bacterium]
MNPLIVLISAVGYFALLLLIARFTSKNSNNSTFFTGNRQSPWFVVAFGMIGASLSGVTLISIPGEVGNSGFEYFQLVLGYLLGYAVIAFILMPLYYKLNLVSIYSYLGQRFGKPAYKTGAIFFLISQTIGASFRLFLAAIVLQITFFAHYGIPFSITVAVTIILIWLYTHKGGIKTIVWTDTLQTFFMLLAVILTIIIILRDLHPESGSVLTTLQESHLTRIFNWDWRSPNHFVKQFLSGAFIAIVMTGLDQNMMQKNLTCRNLRDAQKNMMTFSLILLPVNLIFLTMGALMYLYVQQAGLTFTDTHGFMFDVINQNYIHTDALYPLLSMNYLGTIASVVFIIGVIAAAYSSADSAMAALTTSFCIDILNFRDFDNIKKQRIRFWVHVAVSVVVFLTILLFRAFNNTSVINAVFTMAGYTYGPLLGLYSFGLFTRLKPAKNIIPLIALISPALTWYIGKNSETWFNGYKFGFELLLVNGALTFIGLLLISRRSKKS